MHIIATLLLAALPIANVKLPNGSVLKVEVVTPDTPGEFGRGLLGRKSIAPDSGMLFVYPGPQRTKFNLMGYEVPVDIVYLDDTKTIVNLKPNAAPCPIKPGDCGHDSIWDHKYALQLQAGSIKRLKIFAGDKVSFDLPPNK